MGRLKLVVPQSEPLPVGYVQALYPDFKVVARGKSEETNDHWVILEGEDLPYWTQGCLAIQVYEIKDIEVWISQNRFRRAEAERNGFKPLRLDWNEHEAVEFLQQARRRLTEQ